MQTDLNSFNLWEEKYESKAVVIALNNYLHFFFCDKNCDNYHSLWLFLCANQHAYLELSTTPKKRNCCLSFTVEESRTPEVKKLYLCISDFPSMTLNIFQIYNRS